MYIVHVPRSFSLTYIQWTSTEHDHPSFLYIFCSIEILQSIAFRAQRASVRYLDQRHSSHHRHWMNRTNKNPFRVTSSFEGITTTCITGWKKNRCRKNDESTMFVFFLSSGFLCFVLSFIKVSLGVIFCFADFCFLPLLSWNKKKRFYPRQ